MINDCINLNVIIGSVQRVEKVSIHLLKTISSNAKLKHLIFFSVFPTPDPFHPLLHNELMHQPARRAMLQVAVVAKVDGLDVQHLLEHVQPVRAVALLIALDGSAKVLKCCFLGLSLN